MPLISIPRHDILEQNKLRLLEELADLNVALALPPTDRIPQDREALLSEIQEIDRELAAVGIDTDYGCIVSMAEGFWEADDAKEG